MSKILKIVGLQVLMVLVVLGIIGIVFKKMLVPLVMQQVISYDLKERDEQYEDGLYAFLCGTGSPMPDANRAGPCIAVMAGSHFFVVDAGEGSTKNILLMHLPLTRTDAILLTHFHSDHIADLGEMMMQRWAGGSNTVPADIIGPEGVEKVVAGFNMAYQLDAGYRVAHHGPQTMPPSGFGGIAKTFLLGDSADASAVVYDQDGVKVIAFKVDHRPVIPAVGYRFEYKGRSLVVSGDTKYSSSLMEYAKGADILFHEMLNTKLVSMMHDAARDIKAYTVTRVMHDIPEYHSSPEDAGRIASGAGVRQLVFYHIIPPMPVPILKDMYKGDADKYFSGPITMGEDGMSFFLPPNTTIIKESNRLH